MNNASSSHKGMRTLADRQWAKVFDELCLPWEYCLGYYQVCNGHVFRPDFWLPSLSLWVKTGYSYPSLEEQRREEYAELLFWQKQFVEATGFAMLHLGPIPDSSNAVLVSHYTENETNVRFNGYEKTFPIPSPKLEPKDLFYLTSEMTETFDASFHLHCPICGHAGMHFSEPETRYTHSTQWQGDNGCIVIPMYCECGHGWNLVFGSHEGDMFLTVRDCTLTTGDPEILLSDNNKTALELAYRLARRVKASA